MEHLRQPPHSLQAEQAVLGGLLMKPAALTFVQEILTGDDFYRREHRLIFDAIERVADGGEVDIVTVAERLEADDNLDGMGGLPYLGELHDNTPTAKNIGSYARIVSNHAKARALWALSPELVEATGDDWMPIADRIMARLTALSGVQRKWECNLNEALVEAVSRVETAYQTAGLVGLTTGLRKLDERLGGLHETDLVVVGGRPSMGKTAFMLKLLLAPEVPAGVISAEQPRDQLALRMAAMLGKISATGLRNGNLGDSEWPKLTSAVSTLSQRPVYINDQPGVTIQQICRQARAWKQRHDIKVLFVDYLQKIKTTNKNDRRDLEVGEVVTELKNLAKELRIPVVALAQVNRSVEARQDKRPSMGDLKDSGVIEQEADEVILLYRDEVYNPDSPDAGTAELIIDKNRHGPIGFTRVSWCGDHMLFQDLAPSWEIKHYQQGAA